MLRRIAVIVLPVMIFGISSPAPATEKGYRYWGYFQAIPGSSSWTEAITGPTTNVPDGSVEGWVHTFASNSVSAYPPRTAPSFNALCKKTTRVTGKKRIGVIVDFGSFALKPRGESLPRRVMTCVQIDSNATGAEILAAATKIRFASSGFICGINGYPAKECSAEIATPRSLMK